jgi:hypothetical protein
MERGRERERERGREKGVRAGKIHMERERKRESMEETHGEGEKEGEHGRNTWRGRERDRAWKKHMERERKRESMEETHGEGEKEGEHGINTWRGRERGRKKGLLQNGPYDISSVLFPVKECLWKHPQIPLHVSPSPQSGFTPTLCQDSLASSNSLELLLRHSATILFFP